MSTPTVEPQTLLRDMFHAAVSAAQPSQQMQYHLPPMPKGRVLVIGAGKGSAAMAQALEAVWPIDRPVLQGLVVTRYGYSVPCQHIEIIEAAHPVPDAAGERAAQRMLALVDGLSSDDLVIALISGGGSSLLPLSLPGLGLEDKQNLGRQLLKSGASISEMNCVRRHLSAIKGGRLAAACAPAAVWNILISDVPGDDPADIASGPTVADASTTADALAVLQRYEIDVPAHVMAVLQSPLAESCKPNAAQLPPIETRMIATPQMALEAAAATAKQAGFTPYILGDAIEGEAREVGKVLAAIAQQVQRHGQPQDAGMQRPCVLLSGGETTVTVRGKGRGGRNVECLLSMAIALRGEVNIYALAADTDGVDGQEEIAGGIITPQTLQRARQLGMQPVTVLDNNDGHGFFEALGDAVITGPTMTNVNDFRAIVIL